MPVCSGVLYIVATPIGNLEDLSARAIRTLQNVKVIFAEDTRHSQKLLAHFAIHAPLSACHEHNEREKSLEIIELLKEGKSCALISDAGTPVFSDPGAFLVDAVLAAGIQVIPVPGACAAITALSASGYVGNPLHFYGFLPAHKNEKHRQLTEIKCSIAGVLAFYEAPHRLMQTLQIFAELWGQDHTLVLAKELTKLHETIYKNSIAEIIAWLLEDEKRMQGEFVLLLENTPPQPDTHAISLSLDVLLQSFLKHFTLKDAVAEAVELTGLPKNQVYTEALKFKSKF